MGSITAHTFGILSLFEPGLYFGITLGFLPNEFTVLMLISQKRPQYCVSKYSIILVLFQYEN